MAYWGKQWLMLPNPTYGSFDIATYGHDFKKPRRRAAQGQVGRARDLGRAEAVGIA